MSIYTIDDSVYVHVVYTVPIHTCRVDCLYRFHPVEFSHQPVQSQ